MVFSDSFNTVKNKTYNENGIIPEVIIPFVPNKTKSKYTQDDLKIEQNYHSKSYYIPPYCMPGNESEIYFSNPFCNQYRPYGSNMYLGF